MLGQLIALVFTVVITDPYQGLDYDSINVYNITSDDDSYGISIVYPEGEDEYSQNHYEEEQEVVYLECPETEITINPSLLYNTSTAAEDYYFSKLLGL